MDGRITTARGGGRALGLLGLLLFLSAALGLGVLQVRSPEGRIPFGEAATWRSLAVVGTALVASFGLWRRSRWGAFALGLWSLLLLSRMLWPPTPIENVSVAVQSTAILIVGGLLAGLNAWVWTRVGGGRAPG